jgi:hypothetical protein
MDDMMAIDAKGGMGKPGTFNLASASSTHRAALSLTLAASMLRPCAALPPWQQTIPS